MAVVIETTLGDITVDLFLHERPRACLNFLKLCKFKFYNYNLFHTIQHGFIAQTGDPTGSGHSGTSIWGVIEGSHKRYFEGESLPKIRHSEPGLLSMVSSGGNIIGSQFFFTLGQDLTSLDGIHCVIGEVTEGHDVLRKLNEVICDDSHRPYKDVRITHTVILEDPFDDPSGFNEPSRSPSPTLQRMQGGRIGADEEIDDTEGKTQEEIQEMLQAQEAKARATILEIVGDLPDADVAPPENVLFVCKLNPVTTDDDLEIIFSRFGKIKSCEVIRDRITGDSLQYAFVEFEDQKSCEDAYFKMDNVLIDDRRIHVDFSQSVSKIKWRGKGKGVIHMDDEKNGKFEPRNRKRNDDRNNRNRRSPQNQNISRNQRPHSPNRRRSRSRSPMRQSIDKSRRDYQNYDRNRDRERQPYNKTVDHRQNRRRSRSPQRSQRDRYPQSKRSRSPQRKRSNSPTVSAHSTRRSPTNRRINRSPSPSFSRKLNKRPTTSSKIKRTEIQNYGTSSSVGKKKHKGDSSPLSEKSPLSASSESETEKLKRKKQKRNKTKKSKKSRTSSDDSSSSDTDDSNQKKKKKKHKKAR